MRIDIEDIFVLPLYKVTKTEIIQNLSDKILKVGLPQKEDPPIEPPEGFKEGGIKQIIIEIKDRSPELRRQAIIKNGGTTCCICGFNFEDTYGDFGEGYFEVHHLIPLSNSKGERSTNIDEVAVVCANCHGVLHHNGKKPIDVDELKKIVEERRQNWIS